MDENEDIYVCVKTWAGHLASIPLGKLEQWEKEQDELKNLEKTKKA